MKRGVMAVSVTQQSVISYYRESIRGHKQPINPSSSSHSELKLDCHLFD